MKPTAGMEELLKPHIDAALKIIREIEIIKSRYDNVNSLLQKDDEDFAPRVQHMPARLEGKVVDLLDQILGENLASYYLYECKNMKGGAVIKNGAKAWRIHDIDDLVRYILERPTPSQPAPSDAPSKPDIASAP